MARLAATDFGADWVINSDVDEFWWPRDGSLREVLDSVPPRFGLVHGLWRHFVLRPEGDEPFYERMIVRRAPATDETSTYVPAFKVIHRADPNVVVGRGQPQGVRGQARPAPRLGAVRGAALPRSHDGAARAEVPARERASTTSA